MAIKREVREVFTVTTGKMTLHHMRLSGSCRLIKGPKMPNTASKIQKMAKPTNKSENRTQEASKTDTALAARRGSFAILCEVAFR